MATTPSSSSNRFFAGVDGGGSTTRVVLASEDGLIRGFGEAGGSNPNYGGVAAAAGALRAAFEAAWTDAKVPPHSLLGVFFGIAGITTFRKHASIDPLTKWLALSSGATLEVDHDLRVALAGGLSGRPGIVVIAGTGSAGYGRNAEGQTWQAGGWGSLLDDFGSGYWLGLSGLRALAEATDGRRPPTEITEKILGHLFLQEPREITGWLARNEMRRETIATLAPLVFSAAENGDPSCVAIINEGADRLAQIGGAIAHRIFPETTAEVVFSGGTSHHSHYRKIFADRLAQRAGRLRLVSAERSPVMGALVQAFINAGAKVPWEKLNSWSV